MKSILFIPFSLSSHITATLGIANALSTEYNVYYAALNEYRDYICDHGHNFCLLNCYPFGYGFEKVARFNEKSKDLNLDSLLDVFSSRLYNIRFEKLLEIVNSVKPD